MRVSPHLVFNGNCEEALKFYERALGGKITFATTYGDSPMMEKVPKEYAKKFIHASFEVNNQTILAADAFPNYYKKPEGFSITLDFKSTGEAEKVFVALSEKGEIQMPIQETFWATRFGMVTDQFGTPWMINCGKAK